MKLEEGIYVCGVNGRAVVRDGFPGEKWLSCNLKNEWGLKRKWEEGGVF